jgi:hypothetical protein
VLLPAAKVSPLFRRSSRISHPVKARAAASASSPRASERSPTLLQLRDFPATVDDRIEMDVCLGLPGSGGLMQRVLSRQLTTLRAAIQYTCELAEQLARVQHETVVSPSHQPSAIHWVDDAVGCTLWLDYDLGPLGQERPRVSHSLRLMLSARPVDAAASVASGAPSTRNAALTDSTAGARNVREERDSAAKRPPSAPAPGRDRETI